MICFLFTSVISQASLTGKWTGFGSWKFKGEGEGLHCSPIRMQWSETKNTLTLETGVYDCEIVIMHLGKSVWAIKDGLLFDENQKEVGTYDGANLEAYMPSPNENTTIHFKIKREGNHYDFTEIWFNSVEKVYVIEGRLFTSGN